jgi:LL-diaminopimelate aminotransferase
MKNLMADRLRDLPPYLFARIDQMKSEALSRGVDVIDLGVGDPDVPTPKKIVDRLAAAAREAGSHHYSSYSGLRKLREAFSEWFRERFAVELDPDGEVLPLLGSKEGIGHIYFALFNPGDEVLIPDPGYPVYTAGATLVGAVPRYYALYEENGFLPDEESLKKLVTAKTRMLWLNYPSNPTGALAGIEDFEKGIRLARKGGFVVCHDAAYSEIVFDGKKAPSVLQVPGAKETAVEFHSLSKTFCMPGWRVGFAAGNREVISALAQVKTNLDSGIFLPVQEAAVTALRECREDAKRILAVFEDRRNRFVNALNGAGWKVTAPPATFYVWVKVPAGSNSMSFTSRLLRECGIVSTPGIGFGPNGEGFVRMSLTLPEDRLEKAIERLRRLK